MLVSTAAQWRGRWDAGWKLGGGLTPLFAPVAPVSPSGASAPATPGPVRGVQRAVVRRRWGFQKQEACRAKLRRIGRGKLPGGFRESSGCLGSPGCELQCPRIQSTRVHGSGIPVDVRWSPCQTGFQRGRRMGGGCLGRGCL